MEKIFYSLKDLCAEFEIEKGRKKQYRIDFVLEELNKRNLHLEIENKYPASTYIYKKIYKVSKIKRFIFFTDIIEEYNLEKEFIDFFNNTYLKRVLEWNKYIKNYELYIIKNLDSYYNYSDDFKNALEESSELLNFLKENLEKKNCLFEEESFEDAFDSYSYKITYKNF